MVKKKRFFISLTALTMTLTFAVAGVFSALNAKNWSVGGKISLSVDNIDGFMVVYEGNFDGNELSYYSKDVADKAFNEIDEAWKLDEDYTTLTMTNPTYFYQVVIQNTNQNDVYVSFEIPTAIAAQLSNIDDTRVNGSWLLQTLWLGIYDEYEKADVTNNVPLTAESLENATKTFLHQVASTSQFSNVPAESYNENSLNNLGESTNDGYTIFSIKLEAGQVFSLYSFYEADFVSYDSETDSAEFDVENNFSVNFFKPAV